MRPLGPLATVALLSLLAGPALPVDAAVSPILAEGFLAYTIVQDGVPPSCAGDGPFVAAYDSASRRLSITGSAIGCAPVASSISGCAPLENGTIRCSKDQGGHRIEVTLSADGRFDYLWAAPDFHETIRGAVERFG